MMGRHLKIYPRKLLALAVASCFAGELAYANPAGPAVARGQASFATQGNTLTVTNSPGAIINWQGFSIPSQDITRFLQQSASSAVLNRVTGATPSAILGQLQSNGRVYLINPNGITIGKGAVIDVAGFVASSLNLSDADFVAGRHRFTETPGAGPVINQGTIKTPSGGMVYLVGQNIENHGIIKSPQGEIVLAAGKSVELVDAGTPEIRVQITAPDNQALNLGQLFASGGRIGMYGGLVRQGGIANANTAVVGENGKIVFKATKDVTLDAGSLTTASGPSGGSVTAQAETGTLLASGTIEAIGLGSPPAGGGVAQSAGVVGDPFEGGVAATGDGVVGKGGTVHLLGTQVGLTGNAKVDVSGQSGGGTVLVGGDFQGKNPDIQNAFRTYFGPDAVIKADAITSGDGGKVIVWADDITWFYGTITARGGSQSGNGGFVEVSGKANLAFDGRVDAGAPNGQAGTLLLDPQDINIVDSAGTNDNNQLNVDVPTAGDPAGSVFFANGGAVTFTITDEALESQTGNIVLQATRDITVSAGLSGGLNLVNQGTGERVAVQAGRHINILSPLTTNGAAIILEADSPHAGATDRIGQITVAAAASVISNGGSITLIAGGNATGSTATSDAVADNSGFRPVGIVDAGAGGINLALSGGSADELGIGVTGTITQILGNHITTPSLGSITNLRTTGALVIGSATSAGTNGLGSGAQTLTVNRISNTYTDADIILLATPPASSFQMIAGSGGIQLDRPLTTYQPTTISTSGPLTITDPIITSNNSLTLSASSVTGSGFINTGSGSCYGTGCVTIFWDGGAGTPNWFDQNNWSGNLVPGNSSDVTIGTGFATIVVNGLGQAKSLVAGSAVQVPSTRSLTLTNASNLSGADISGGGVTFNGGASVGSLALSSGTVNGSGILAVTSDFNQTGGSLASTFSNLALTRSGNFTVGGFQASNSISLTAAGGALLDGNGTSVNVTAPTTTLTAANGINLDTSVSTLTTGNTATGNTAIRNTGPLTVSGMSNAGAGTILLTNTDRITLNGAVSASGGSGNQIVLAGTGFTNNAGSSALNPGSGRWLVYSGNPASDNRGGLGYGFKQYNATYGVTSIAGSGNGFLYTTSPSITPSLGGTATKVYDGNTAAPTISLTASPFSGVIDGDSVSLTAGAASYLDKNVGSSKQVNASGISIASATDGAATVYGYQLLTTASANVGTITARALTIGATGQNKVYDGGTAGTVTLADNRVAGDVLTTSYTGAAFNDKNVGTGKPVSVTGLGLTGTDAGNYTFNATAGTAADINPAVVSLAGNRAYDSSTSFGPGAFGTINGVNGETLTVASGTGTVASPKVLAGTQSLAPGDLALGNGTGLASNYRIAANNNTGTITATTSVPFAWDGSATDLRWENPANWNQGAIPLNGAMANIPGGLSGPVVYSSVSGATSLKTLSSASGFLITGGTLTLGNSPADVSTFSGRPLTLSGGTLNGTGTISLAGTTLDVNARGLLGGSRTILGNVNNFEGTVSPGASPGIMTIDGNYYQGPLGTLLAEIGGPVAGAQYDQLIVTGTVTLGGALNVAFVNGFNPATNDAFTIVQSGAISGTFASEPSTTTLVTNYLASGVTLTNSAIIPDSILNTQFNQMNNATPDSTGALNVETTINAETGEREIVDSTTAVNAKPTLKAGLCR